MIGVEMADSMRGLGWGRFRWGVLARVRVGGGEKRRLSAYIYIYIYKLTSYTILYIYIYIYIYIVYTSYVLSLLRCCMLSLLSSF